MNTNQLPTPKNTGTSHEERRFFRREHINDALRSAHFAGSKTNFRIASDYVRACEQDEITEKEQA